MIINEDKQVLGFDVAKKVSTHLRSQIRGGEECDAGATFKPHGKELSLGCQACKTSGFLCVYLSFKCNKRCHYCTQSRHGECGEAPMWPPLNGQPTIDGLDKIHDKDGMTGIGFTGGEPMLQLDSAEGKPGIYDWLKRIGEVWKRQPYLWIYTNGMLVTEDKVKKLVDSGINEIRFDLAATDYNDEIIKKMEYTRKHVDKLCVEVPVLGWQMHDLLRSLDRLDGAGLDYINLHEMRLTSNNWDYMVKSGLVDHRLAYSISLDMINPNWDFYLPSLIDTYTVIRAIEEGGYSMIYNDCGSRHYRLQDVAMAHMWLRNNPNYDREAWPWDKYLASWLTKGA